ncbi:MAG: acyltransferase [gamma proteobacterium symbiont of Taylorina sp.]|nr:acyltransferase [gamma proteobacterium symbiont of Taylorina sp.]
MLKQKKTLSYRPDIDGLRAIAVLAVIFYHLDIPFISGGFVGVDIFFVISGFLIGSIIYSEIQADRFSLVNFYIRRIRRIFPVLFFIVLITSIAALMILPRLQLGEFSESVISAAWFVSNFFFWFHNDYFSVAAELKPLLHTWSLSVEEQFYVFFPLLMLILNKRQFYITTTLLILLLLLSFVVSLYLSETYASANFYLAPTRAWEFLSGVILAIGLFPDIKSFVIRQCLSLSGIALLLSSMVLLDDHSIFPGINAIYPVLGSVLLIHTGSTRRITSQTWVSIVISSAVFRYIGLISYSLYLWHWPVIALLKNYSSGELNLFSKAIIFFIVFIFSIITYQFIEQPFRNHARLRKMITLKTGLLIILMMSATGLGLYYYSKRIDIADNVQTREEVLQQMAQLKTCFLKKESLKSISRCSFGDKTSDKIFLLWGDSHTLAMYPAFVKLAKQAGWRGIHATLTGCPPLFEVTVDDVKQCNGMVAQNIKNFLLNNKIDVVFLVSRWNLYETGWIRNGRLMKPNSFVSDHYTKGVDAQSSTQVLHRAIEKTVQFLTVEAGVDVNLLLPVPVLPDLIDKYQPEDNNILRRSDYLAQRASIVQRINELNYTQSNEAQSFHVIDPLDALCAKKNCKLFEQGKALYLDDNHLSPSGAMMIFPLLEDALHYNQLLKRLK